MPMTDEDAALQAIATLNDLTEDQLEAKSAIDEFIASDVPFVDVQRLFKLYDVLYFCSLLSTRVEASWSTRLTLCAGICELVRDPLNNNRFTKIRLKLSEPLLKYRPRSDVINTLLHEAIHAYFFVTTSWRHARGDDGTGHGPGFLLLSDAINEHGSYGITVFHNFHDEVDAHRTHIWQCSGPCKESAPFFGMVKRSMNRAPGPSDSWWKEHKETCGGDYVKISEPEISKSQINKLSALQRAGRQKNKLDGWMKSHQNDSGGTSAKDAVPQHVPSHSPAGSVLCPICNLKVSESVINDHIDNEHFNP